MLCSSCGAPRRSDTAAQCAECGATFTGARTPGRPATGAVVVHGVADRHGAAATAIVLEGELIVPPSRQNGPVDHRPQAQPPLLAGPAGRQAPPPARALPGAGAAAGGPHRPDPVAGPHRPTTRPARARKRARAGLVAAVAVLAVAAVAAGGAVVVGARVFGPGSVALAYLDAVARGDAGAALAARTGGDRGPLLSDEVLRAPGVALPEDIEIVSTVESGGTATVTTAFTLGGEPQAMSLTLTAAGRVHGVFDDWRVASGLGTLTPSGVALPVTVAGVTLAADRAAAAFPARYPMALADPTGTYSATRTAVTVLDAPVDAAPGARIAPATLDRVRRALETRLAECAARTDPFMFDCPFDLRAAHTFFAGSARWTLQRTPQVNLDVAATGGIDVTTTAPGTVDYEAAMLDGTTETGTVTYPVDGHAALADDGTVTVTFTAAPAGS